MIGTPLDILDGLLELVKENLGPLLIVAMLVTGWALSRVVEMD